MAADEYRSLGSESVHRARPLQRPGQDQRAGPRADPGDGSLGLPDPQTARSCGWRRYLDRAEALKAVGLEE